MAVTTKRTRVVLGGLFFATMFVYAGGTAYQTFQTRRSSTGWDVAARGGRVFVEEVSSSGPAGQLRPGDVVISVDGRRVDGPEAVRDLAAREPGHVYALSVEREGLPVELSLRTAAPPSFAKTYYTLLVVVIPLIFISTGLAVFALRPEDKQAVLLALMFGTFIPGGAASFRGLPDWLADAMVVGAVVSSFFAAVFFHFFLVFPERSPLLRRFPRLEYALYVPQLLLVAPYVAYTAYVRAAAGNLFAERGSPGPAGVAVAALVVAYVVAGVVSLVFNYGHAGRQSRRKMRVVVAGCALGFLPSLLLTAVYFYGPTRIDETLFKWLSAAAGVAFLAFPFSFAYAIVRHQVIPVRLMFRRGVRHVFVARGSVLLEVVTVGLALTLFLQYFFNYVRPSSGLVIGVVSGVFSVLVWNLTTELHYRVIAPAIDRRFFRRAYNAQQILADLGQSLRPLADTRETAQFVAARLRDALQPENVSVFLRDADTGDYVCAVSSHHIDAGRVTLDGAAGDLVLPREAFAVRRLRESSQPLAVDFHDPQSWASMLLSADLELTVSRRRESETLRQINSSLLVPVATKSELLGVISVGPRLGDLPYSRDDRQVLTAVALQMSFAVENALLLRRKVEEDRLRREVEMATEVQRRLFPERPPWLDSVELAGICLPARGVGGDYYDFILLDEERVGVAVADVAGKGISAALLMSTVQASLRSRAEQVDDDRLTDLVASMNRLLNRSTNSASYASFFYALFDGGRRQLTYVNAGHNPPLLVRGRARAARAGSAAAEPRRLSVGGDAESGGVLLSSEMSAQMNYLTTGGPVIGLFDEFVYEQETINTESGDVIVAYTDGVTEALNPRGEEFGQERLEALAEDLAHLPAEELMKRIIEDLRRWCQNTPQHDDVTLVIVKVR